MRFYTQQHQYYLRDRSARKIDVPVHHRSDGDSARAPKPACRAPSAGAGDRPLQRRPGDSGGMHLHLVLDRRPLRPARGAFRPRSRSVQDEPSTEPRPRTTRSTHRRSRPCCVEACSPRPMPILKDMRSTRDLLRRRMYLMHHRSELLAHIQNTRT